MSIGTHERLLTAYPIDFEKLAIFFDRIKLKTLSLKCLLQGGQHSATHKIDAKIVQAECKCKKKTKFLFLALPKRSLSKATANDSAN